MGPWQSAEGHGDWLRCAAFSPDSLKAPQLQCSGLCTSMYLVPKSGQRKAVFLHISLHGATKWEGPGDRRIPSGIAGLCIGQREDMGCESISFGAVAVHLFVLDRCLNLRGIGGMRVFFQGFGKTVATLQEAISPEPHPPLRCLELDL